MQVKILSALFLAVMLTACASYSSAPVGGPKDELPPIMLEARPSNASTNFAEKTIELRFDEFIELREQDKIYTSPRIEKISYKFNLKKLYINIEDTNIRKNTTYTIEFGKSLVDMHEYNPMEGFSYVFSTGNVIDSSFLDGVLVNAFDSKAVEGASILFFEARSDSFPFNDEPNYIAHSDKDGYFVCRNMKEACYYVYAVLEQSKDYRINPVEEDMAFSDTCVKTLKYSDLQTSGIVQEDSLAEPYAEDTVVAASAQTSETNTATIADTIAATPSDTTISADSNRTKSSSRELLKLKMYRDFLPEAFYKEHSFDYRYKASVSFNYRVDSIESLRILMDEEDLRAKAALAVEDTANSEFEAIGTEAASAAAPAANLGSDSSTTYIELDTKCYYVLADDKRSVDIYFEKYDIEEAVLVMQIAGGYTDSIDLYLSTNARRTEDTLALSLKLEMPSPLYPSDTIYLISNIPIDTVDKKNIRIWTISTIEPQEGDTAERMDTTDIEFDIEQKTPFRIALLCQMQEDINYTLFVKDSAFFDLWNRSNDTLELRWKPSPFKENGKIRIKLENLKEDVDYVIFAVDASGKEAESVRLEALNRDVLNTVAEFTSLRQGTFSFVLIEDLNQNSKWDSGDYAARRQPEPRYTYSKTLRADSNWTYEETWRL